MLGVTLCTIPPERAMFLGKLIWSIPAEREILLGRLPGLGGLHAGSCSVSLEVESWASVGASSLPLSPLASFSRPRFLLILLSFPLEELTLFALELGTEEDNIIFFVFPSCDIESSEESVPEELDKLDSTLWFDSMGRRRIPDRSRCRSNWLRFIRCQRAFRLPIRSIIVDKLAASLISASIPRTIRQSCDDWEKECKR